MNKKVLRGIGWMILVSILISIFILTISILLVPKAVAVGGTCCKQSEALCVIPPIVISNYYYNGEGPCPEPQL